MSSAPTDAPLPLVGGCHALSVSEATDPVDASGPVPAAGRTPRSRSAWASCPRWLTATCLRDSACEDIAAERANAELRYTWSFERPTRVQGASGRRYGYCWVPEA